MWIVQLCLQHYLGGGCDSNHCCVMELLLDRTNYLNWFFDWLFVCQNCKRWAAAFLQFFCHAKAKLPREHWTSTFCRRKKSASNSSHTCFTQEVIGSGPGKLENKPRESRGTPGRNFRCRWFTPLFAKRMKSIFALSHFASTAVFLVDSRTWIVHWWSYTVKVSALKLR